MLLAIEREEKEYFVCYKAKKYDMILERKWSVFSWNE